MFLLVSDYIPHASNYVLAAETVVLEYKIFRESIAVDELSTFARTGKLSNSLRINLALARKEPWVIRQYLTTPVKVSPVLLDRALNSPVGNIILDELSQVIHTPSRRADRQALRSALVLSAVSDRQVTLIEVIENYPTQNVEVDGERLESAYRQLRRLQTGLENLLP
ncbi:alpha/beta hydrolase [Nostoc sp. NIES-2111]